ncbi:hypothetical protein U5801_14305 [Lamprobacter modestohalophilus]|uniref:hypothetical protein n=1 Tax=Lamprobacter modestohalophilus TaxID=1064514 RepID=UPI002ADEE827|nr:hypothetical protein [Lamprobacter modestohalophilus]MEA1050972.1 hypothetical protein [Lamprobacter modestohalophilus]
MFFVGLLSFNGACTEEHVKYVFPMGRHYDLVYQGGIRLEAGTFGTSRLGYTVGPIAVNEQTSMLWIAGHAQHYSVGAFKLPDPVNSFEVQKLPIAKNSQPFVKIKPNVKLKGNPGRITGLQVIGKRLWVSVAEYYDANGDNKNTTVVFDDAWNLQGSPQYGYFELEGRAHASGWMTRIPATQVKDFGGEYVAGYASNIPINSRHSIGPSLFVWNPSEFDLKSNGEQIPATAFINYSLSDPLHEDGYNKSGKNDLWTELSRAHIGFIPPGSQDYLVIGTSSGHESGIGYKIKQDNGNLCGGPCAHDHDDVYNYFWRYDLNDINALRAGTVRPSSLRPAEYDVLPVFNGRVRGTPLLIGAAFIPETSRLYLLFSSVDGTQSKWERQPVLLVYLLRPLSNEHQLSVR